MITNRATVMTFLEQVTIRFMGLRMRNLLRCLSLFGLLFGCRVAVAQDAISIDREDIELWQAGIQGAYYQNRVCTIPQEPPQHADLMSRSLALPPDTDRGALANAIMVQDILLNRAMRDSGNTQQAIKELPAAWNISRANLYLKNVMAGEPAYRVLADSDPSGGLVELMDRLRREQTGACLTQMALRYVSNDIAKLVDKKYRAMLGSNPNQRPLEMVIDEVIDEVGVYPIGKQGSRFRLGAMMARLSYTGDRPLENVVVVTQTKMRPIGAEQLAARSFVRSVNEALDPGAQRNVDADNYVVASQLMQRAPQGAVAYLQRLEPGDVVYLALYLNGTYWDLQEAKASVFSTTGALLDKVLLTAGPHNDLNAPNEEQRRDAAARVVKTTGPIFKPVPLYERLELTLKPAKDGAATTMEVCVPTQQSFTSLGRSIPVTSQPIVAIAQSPTHYAAVSGKRNVGEGLVLIPKTIVAKAVPVDERNEEELAQARQSEARAKEQQEEQAFQKKISKLSPERQIQETMKRNNEKLRQALSPKKPTDKPKSTKSTKPAK